MKVNTVPATASGFTLLELVIAMGVSTIVLLGLLSLQVFSQEEFARLDRGGQLHYETLMLNEYLNSRLQSAGGGALTLASSIWVEDGCGPRAGLPNCQGSDRVTLVTQTEPGLQCRAISLPSPDTLHIAEGSTGVCCLTPAWAGLNLMVNINDRHVQVVAQSIDVPSCRLRFTPGPLAPHDFPPVSAAGWNGAAVTAMEFRTLFLDHDASLLMEFNDKNRNGVLDPAGAEARILADRVFDLQAALGFDFSPRDGVVADIGSATDEWLYNHAADSLEHETFDKVLPSQLQMVMVGAIMGTVGKTSTAMVLNGPPRSKDGWALKGMQFTAKPRNFYYFK